MAAVYVSNIVINSGADFTQSFSLEGNDSGSAYDLTGYEVNAQFRKWAGSSSSVSFAATITNPPTSGQIFLSLPAETTLSLKAGRYVYDILITDNDISSPTYGIKRRVIEGMVLIREGVTR
jgi:hypothetical protein